VPSHGTRRIRPWAVGLPLALVVALELVRRLLLLPLLGPGPASNVTLALAIAGVIAFSVIIWRLIERSEVRLRAAYRAARLHERQLVALHDAAMAVTAALDLPTVLRRVVEQSRAVIGTRYGAVAVLTPGGAIDEFVASGMDEETVRRLGAPPTGHGLLGLVLAERRTLRVEGIGSHPAAVGFPPGHPAMKNLLAVPLLYQGSVLGSIYVADREDGRPFDLPDQEALERFAAQAAIAVGNARMYGSLQRLALLEERERISMDLHDGVLQTLYATGLGLEAVLEDVGAEPARAREGILRAIDRLHATIADIRHYIFDLRSVQGDGDGSLPALLRQIADALHHPGVEIDVDAGGPEDGVRLPRQLQWECWHVAREAVSNALRHSGCRRVSIALSTGPGALELRVTDDGAGFDASVPAGEGHRGLRNMRRRAAAVGGRLEVATAPGRGTAITLRVPLSSEEGAR
jgi:signal transduction histidine kinase